MIDGFGWFREDDYRRSWLFFDEVSYVLPATTAGPLAYPVGIEQRIDFRLDREPIGKSIEALAEAARRDASEQQFADLVRSMPRKDADYAQTVVWSDVEAREQFGAEVLGSPVLAVAYLLNKLNFCAKRDDLLPLVGQPYASDMLAWKSGRMTEPVLAWKRPPERSAYAAFSAGLSLDFLDDSDLIDADIEHLAKFKAQNRSLLSAHQEALLRTAEAFGKLPDDDAFPQALAALRSEAKAERKRLDAQAREAWVGAGLALLKKALPTAAKAIGGGVLLSTFTKDPRAAIVGAGAVVLSELIDVARATPKVPTGTAYLYRLGDLSREAALGLPQMKG